ncbi:MAG: TIGR00282 family metallophosphoesterase [Planctomycetota bacterium]
MRLLLLGDIVGPPGLLALRQQLPVLRDQHQPDWVIANAENAANGSGLTPELYRKLKDAGVDAMTLGDHALRKKQIFKTLQEAPDLIRPANLPAAAPGRGTMTLSKPGLPDVHVITLLGRLFMTGVQADDPFAALDRYVASLPNQGKRQVVVTEIHAEVTSEKVAMGWHASGRASVVFGTHTHIPTHDARILPAGVPGSGGPLGPPPIPHTAYITDLGMTGPYDSVLGRAVDKVLPFMTTARPQPFDVADLHAAPTVHGIAVRLDPNSGRALAIEPLAQPADVSSAPFV